MLLPKQKCPPSLARCLPITRLQADRAMVAKDLAQEGPAPGTGRRAITALPANREACLQ